MGSGARQALCATVVLQPHYWQTGWFRWTLAAAILMGILGLHRLGIAQVREIERLRLRIAADLHDDVGSNLGAISLLSRKVQKGGAGRQEQQEDLTAINRMAVQASNSIREIVWFINPEYDTLQDLVLRMKEAASAMLAGRECRFETAQEHFTARLPLQVRQDLFLLFKETLTNIVKHSGASHVQITVAERNRTWELSVRDDGGGFDATAPSSGNGLKNMRLRATKLKGALSIESRLGSGTRITFSMRIP